MLTGLLILAIISCGHIEGVSAENGPPGVGVKSEWLLMLGALEMLIPSPLEDGIMSSSSSSDKVSTVDINFNSIKKMSLNT